MITKQISGHAAAAKEIRKVLKETFPTIKFSVNSKSFSGGDSVSIRWIDGPTTDQVDLLVKDYQEGDFNGMIDMYENNNTRSDIPQVKYVLPAREISETAKTNMINDLVKKFGIINKDDDKEWFNKFYAWKDQVVYRYLSDVSFI